MFARCAASWQQVFVGLESARWLGVLQLCSREHTVRRGVVLTRAHVGVNGVGPCRRSSSKPRMRSFRVCTRAVCCARATTA